MLRKLSLQVDVIASVKILLQKFFSFESLLPKLPLSLQSISLLEQFILLESIECMYRKLSLRLLINVIVNISFLLSGREIFLTKKEYYSNISSYSECC